MIPLVLSILARDPLARIIIAGDINHLLDHWKKELKLIGLLQVLTDETQTRIKGEYYSQLDQIFTKLKILSSQVGYCIEDYSDHMSIMLELELNK